MCKTTGLTDDTLKAPGYEAGAKQQMDFRTTVALDPGFFKRIGFWIPPYGFRIPNNWIPDSKQIKIRILDSGLPYMGRCIYMCILSYNMYIY